MGNMLEGVSTVHTLLALQEKICERLGLGNKKDALDQNIRFTYGNFCTKALFERRQKRAIYPKNIENHLCRSFYKKSIHDSLTLKSCRNKFQRIFQPFTVKRWGGDGEAENQNHQFVGVQCNLSKDGRNAGI